MAARPATDGRLGRTLLLGAAMVFLALFLLFSGLYMFVLPYLQRGAPRRAAA